MNNKLDKIFNKYAEHYRDSDEEFELDCLDKKDFKKAALEFGKKLLEEAAENAITFIPSHNHLHSIKAVDKGSITSVLDKYL